MLVSFPTYNMENKQNLQIYQLITGEFYKKGMFTHNVNTTNF